MSCSHIIAAHRTAVVPQNGPFAHLNLNELAGPVIKECLKVSGINAMDVDELILSNALGGGGNPARSAALFAGLPQTTPGLTIDRQCAGGLDVILIADALIRSGIAKIVIAGGVETYSRRPLQFKTFSDGRRPEEYHQASFTPWPDKDPMMADAAATLASDLNIPKEKQDRWAIKSHEDALSARSRVAQEIVPLCNQSVDPFTRKLSTKLCQRAPVLSGSVTAANTSVAADAAAFCILVSEDIAMEIGRPSTRIISGKTIGGQPDCPGTAPVQAIKKTLELGNVKIKNLQNVELMEAYAVQAIACADAAGLDREIINQRGGSLSRGHPIGASGTILTVRLFHDTIREGGMGLAAIASAGGLGTALLMSPA